MPTAHAAQLTVLARAQRDAVRTQHRCAARLRSQLVEYFPAALEAWAGMPNTLLRAEARAILALAPTPGRAARLTRRQITDTLADAGRRRQLDDHADRLHALFRQRQLRHPDAVEEAMGIAMLATVRLLEPGMSGHRRAHRTAHRRVRRASTRLDLLQLPGVGALTGARLLAEIGDDLHRFASARGLRAYAGAAPLTGRAGRADR